MGQNSREREKVIDYSSNNKDQEESAEIEYKIDERNDNKEDLKDDSKKSDYGNNNKGLDKEKEAKDDSETATIIKTGKGHKTLQEFQC